ncbi:hypothetical protein CFSAN001627_13353 [Clostridium botulinum CFSAN001627]|uniref:Uncharacterized protein n=1 Tax=Clostridium botulinum CFSAN001627 TaxID=1232189 RepID=M1ZQ34_CLOBO|nr:hypothetical protein [Clostridium botulinum]EKN41422.1 hypothetical protein CFSAN001627_13353 [Clostridium botulinum CFSAN001627]MBY6923544.1 hypothetical protein [Clostridium botulinum]
MANIYFSTLDRKKMYELPILPEEMPELQKSAKNEIFESFNNGEYNFLGKVSLINFSLESWLPAYPNKYRWAKSQINPYLLINMWNTAMDTENLPRIVINRNENDFLPQQLLNWMVSVEDISWHELNNGDVAYKLDLKQYREIK